jgi:RNA polymerase sigma-70 factor (ECF subfamily)
VIVDENSSTITDNQTDTDPESHGQESSNAMPLSLYEVSLLIRAQSGDMEAFDDLQRQFEAPLRSFVRRLIGDGEFEDITQEVFLTLFRHLGNINPPEKLRPFLYRVARNRCYDELRQRGRFEVMALDDEPTAEWVSFQTSEAQPPEDLAHWLLLHLEVQEAMLELPELQRQALILYAEEGFSYTEIAETMNTSLGTVKSRIYYAKKRLRQVLRPGVLQALDAAFENDVLENDDVDQAGNHDHNVQTTVQASA